MDNRCAFYKDETECFILTKGKCEHCSFFKTKKQLEEGREKAKERIIRLCIEDNRPDLERYLTIPEKYRIKKIKETKNNV